MSVPAPVLLGLPADRAARLLALRRLEEAARARARLEAPDDPGALHDFRAALRRLRSTLRAYRPHLRGSVRRRDRRRLRALAAAARAACAQVDPSPRRELAADFDRVRRRLEKRLRSYRAKVDPADPRGGPLCAEVVRGLTGGMAEELRSRLEAVRSAEDRDEARRARTTARRLRYLLEPFADGVEGLAALVGRLETLQDLLGEMRDDGERARLFAELEAWWLGHGAAAFFEELREVERKLDGGAPEDTEIERKYLLSGFPGLDGVEPEEIDQGWIPGERLAERVRRVRSGGEARWYRTVKLGRGVQRVEVEEETPATLAKALWRLTRGKRVRKLRYRVPEGGLVWEIDRFRGRRLVLAEVELPGEDTPVVFPGWLHPYVVREVTGEPEYLNLNLAR